MSSGKHLQEEISQRRPFHSTGAEVVVGVLRTAAVIERYFNQVLMPHGLTIQQYNVLRILRGAGTEGLPTLTIRDRMVHEAPGITRLIDKLEEAGLVRRERAVPDRRQVFCFITQPGLDLLTTLDVSVNAADDAAVEMLSGDDQKQLVSLLDAVRAGHRKQARPTDTPRSPRQR